MRPDSLRDDGPPRSGRRRDQPLRTCIVSRQALPSDRLIRFVAAPDGTVVADLRRRLPGRGAWVTADAEHVRMAERRKMFARALGTAVVVDPGLADRVGDALRRAALAALSLARKAGTAVTGFAKVEAAIAGDRVVAVVHAADAGDDGVAKLAAAVRRRFGRDANVPTLRLFSGEELSLAFGRPHVIHAALLAGDASANVLERASMLAAFLGEAASIGGSPAPSDRDQ